MQDDIIQFAARCQRLTADYYARTYDDAGPVMTVQFGKKFARIVRTDANGSGRSVHCFVDMTNGDIRKASGWKAVAKHARGNINDDSQGMDAMTPYGAVYFKAAVKQGVIRVEHKSIQGNNVERVPVLRQFGPDLSRGR